MKYHSLLLGLLSAVAVSCTVTEIGTPERPTRESTVLYATIEDQPDDQATRTYTDESLRIKWNADDRITVFYDIPVVQEYAFQGEDGATSGNFDKVPSTSLVSGDYLDGWIYAVYPYRKTTSISDEGILSLTLPEVQTFQGSKSFGKEANLMVARTPVNDNRLRFKNAGGFLSFKLYGSGVSVSSVILKGKNGESLAGDCSIDMSSGLPEVTMAENASDEVRIYCENPVDLAATAEEYTEFMFVLPPVTFSDEGFTLIVTTPDGGVYTKDIPVALEIERSYIKRFAPLKVVPVTPSDDLRIATLSSDFGLTNDGNPKTYYAAIDESKRADTLTIPTCTDFSKLVLNYELLEDDDMLRADGQKVVNGVTEVDVSKPVTLMVCRGYQEKRYTLLARNTGLPVVRITTTGFTLADVEGDEVTTVNRVKVDNRVWRPSNEQVENNDPSVRATIRVEEADGRPGLRKNNKGQSGDPIYEVDTQIKGRGNATWKYNKRPYALKFVSKAGVFDMKPHKRWILLANWKDRTLLRNDAAFWLSKQTEQSQLGEGFPYTVSGQFVELEFNGVHRGNYYLCEQIKIDENRLNIASKWNLSDDDPYKKTGGFLMEIDNNYDEENKFKSGSFKLKYMFKEPDPEELPDAAKNYMIDFVNNMEIQIKKLANTRPDYDSYRAYLDIDSAIWFLFVNELTGNGDFYNANYSDEWKGPHSTYLYKDRNDANGVKLLHFGPVWDFDYLTFVPGRSSGWYGATQSGYYYYYLTKDPAFRSRMMDLWGEFKTNIAGFESFVRSQAEVIRLSEPINTDMWGYSNTSQDQAQNGDNTLSFQQAVDRMIEAYNARLSWMDANIGKLK